MQRIYLSSHPEKTFRSADAELHHQLGRVMRTRPGDRVLFFGENFAAEYEITEITKRDIAFVWKKDEMVIPASRNITLFQSIPNKLEKAEYIVQKGVEVGISKFVFFKAERSQVLPVLEKKLERLQVIAKEALEQSGGFEMPSILLVDTVDQMIWKYEKVFILHTSGEVGTKTIKDILLQSENKLLPKNIAILVGPEGGFSPSEVEKFVSLWAECLSLGQRILRTETAGVVAGFSLLQ